MPLSNKHLGKKFKKLISARGAYSDFYDRFAVFNLLKEKLQNCWNRFLDRCFSWSWQIHISSLALFFVLCRKQSIDWQRKLVYRFLFNVNGLMFTFFREKTYAFASHQPEIWNERPFSWNERLYIWNEQFFKTTPKTWDGYLSTFNFRPWRVGRRWGLNWGTLFIWNVLRYYDLFHDLYSAWFYRYWTFYVCFSFYDKFGCAQPVFTGSHSTMETPKQYVKCVES